VDIEVRRIDPSDEAAVRAWWTVTRDAHAERPYNPMRPLELWLRNLRAPSPDESCDAFGAYAGDDLVGTSTVWLPQSDNTHMAYGELTVPPQFRRRGAGTMLLDHFEAFGRAAGRRTFLTEVSTADGAENDGTRFAAAHGYSVANREETKAVDLAAAAPGWAALDAEVAARQGGYRIAIWRGRAPEEYVDGLCALVSQFLGLIPLGDMEIEPVVLTPERLRRDEQRAIDSGRDKFEAVGLAPDGTIVATSNLNLVKADPSRAFIGITMVLPGHRGHALGLGTKLATHRDLMAAYPMCERVATGNANSNTHMNAINERMGYRVLEQILEVQKKL